MFPRVRNLVLVSAALCAALICLPSPASAQGYQRRHEGIGVGVKAGPLFASFDPQVSSNEFDHRTGFVGGLFLGGNRPGVLGAQVEFLYARKGANDPNSSASITADYIEIPVLLRVNIGSNSLNGVNVYALGGPAFDILLRSRLNTGESLTDQTAGGDIGLALGAGVEITRFLIEARYTRGFRNIDKSLDVGEIRNHTFAFFFGVRFN